MYDGIGAAVIGTGFMGPVHIEALRRLGITVVGILGSSEAKSIGAQKRLGIGKAYATLDDLIADGEVSSVHIGTPNDLHFDMASRALKAGKHVMCEKPLAMTTDESAELVRIAEGSGVEAGVDYNMRFYPLNLQAKRMVGQNSIGAVHSVHGGYVQDWLLYDTDYNWRVLSDRGGELRAVSDIGTHWIDLISYITDMRVEAVFADLMTLHTTRKRPRGEVDTFAGKADTAADFEPVPITTDDAGSILLRFSGGARASLWVSQVTAGRKNCLRYEISAAEKALSWNSEEPNELWVGNRGEPNQVIMKDPGLIDAAAASFVGYPGGHNEGYPDSFKMCFKAFYDRIAGLKSEFEYPTFQDGHREIEICEAVLKSHREKTWIDI